MADNALKTPLGMSLVTTSDRRSNNFQQTNTKSMPCHVTKVDKDFVTVAFEPQNNIWTLPTIKLPQSMSRYAREPTQVGDQGYAVPADYNTNAQTGLGGSYTNFYPKGNLTPLSFQPFSRTSNEDRDYDQYTITGGPHGVKIIQSTQKPTEDKPPQGGGPVRAYQRRLRGMGSRARANWLRSRTPAALDGEVVKPSDVPASLIPMTTINIDKLGNMAVNAIKGIAHISDNIMPLTGLPTSIDGIIHMAGKGIAHIADNALGGVLPPQASGILHLAEQAISHTSLEGIITHASLGGAINLVTKQALNIGAPSQAYQYDATTPPQPTQPTLLNLIGSLTASANISAAGSISAPNMSVGGQPVMTGPFPPQLINAPQIVTGAKGNNIALGHLITALVTLGLITDQTTA